MQHEVEQPAFLIRAQPYRENQQIVSLLTETNGIVGAITYISHSTKSIKKALLQPFTPLKVVLKGNGVLQNLSRVEPAGKSFLLKHKHLYSGFYLNELIGRLIEENIPCETLYQQYYEALVELDKAGDIEVVLREFENCILEELGVSIDFSLLLASESESFQYIPEQGFIEASNSSKLPIYQRIELEAIAEQRLTSAPILRSYKQLMRQVFDHLLGYRPLKSRELFIKRKT